MPPTHRDTLQAYDEAMRRFDATWQACALVLLGLSLLGTGALWWQHAAQLQALRATMRTLTAQTQALEALLRPRPAPDRRPGQAP
jgi:hypothetical protein